MLWGSLEGPHHLSKLNSNTHGPPPADLCWAAGRRAQGTHVSCFPTRAPPPRLGPAAHELGPGLLRPHRGPLGHHQAGCGVKGWPHAQAPAPGTSGGAAGRRGPPTPPTFPLHAHGQALLVAAVLAAVALALVDEAVLVVPAGVDEVLPDGPLEEALATLTAVHPVVLSCHEKETLSRCPRLPRNSRSHGLRHREQPPAKQPPVCRNLAETG